MCSLATPGCIKCVYVKLRCGNLLHTSCFNAFQRIREEKKEERRRRELERKRQRDEERRKWREEERRKRKEAEKMKRLEKPLEKDKDHVKEEPKIKVCALQWNEGIEKCLQNQYLIMIFFIFSSSGSQRDATMQILKNPRTNPRNLRSLIKRTGPWEVIIRDVKTLKIRKIEEKS